MRSSPTVQIDGRLRRRSGARDRDAQAHAEDGAYLVIAWYSVR